MSSWLRALVLLSVCALSPRLVLAQTPVVQAKQYFDAGATAYAAGDYQAAIQAFDAAYALTPLAAIAFSLAQAERRQYFVSHEPQHLTRAIELFQHYIQQVSSGGRRADATDALAQLEPLALSQQSSLSTAASAASAPKTRLMVRSATPGASIVLDGAAAVPSPLIAELAVGAHHVRVEAPGYFAIEQQAVAIAGELVPIEITLRQRPALVRVEQREGADIYVDGVLFDHAATSELSLPAGRHTLTFAKKGRNLRSVSLLLAPGESERVSPQLSWTNQRKAAFGLLVVSGATLVTGLVFTGLALHYENDARKIDQRRRATALTPSELHDYHDTVQARDRMRVLAIGGLLAAAGTLITGLLLWQLDDATPHEAAVRSGPRVAILPARSGAELRLALSTNL